MAAFEPCAREHGRMMAGTLHRVLDDFAAVGTFLLYCGGAVAGSSVAYSGRELTIDSKEKTYRCCQRTRLGDTPVMRRKCRAR